MKEIIVKMNADHIKIKGGEYVQDIVRCKECKYATKRLNDDYLCTHHGRDWNYYDHFCSYGERKSGE